MGDINLLGIALKVKNVFGIAKELLPGQLLEVFTRGVSILHYRYSLLFYYRLDEDIGLTFYDSSIYGNNIQSTSVELGNQGKLLWIPNWEQVILNEETWTDDFITYQYMDRGLYFQNGKSKQILLKNIDNMTQEYTIQLCLYLTGISVKEVTILGITELTQLNVDQNNKFIHLQNSNIKQEYQHNNSLQDKWVYIAFANSVNYSQKYLVIDDLGQISMYQNSIPFKADILNLVSFYIGGNSSSETFSGYLRHIKIFRKFLSTGQSLRIIHHQTGIINNNNLNYYGLAAIYPFTEPMGPYIREQISGEQNIIDTNDYDYISYPSLPIMCDGDSQYSNLGYCQLINNWSQITLKVCEEIQEAQFSKNKDLPILIGYFKLDESAGDYIYNTATNAKIDAFIKLSYFVKKWVHDIEFGSSQQINLTVCNEQFNELVDQHCESWFGCYQINVSVPKTTNKLAFNNALLILSKYSILLKIKIFVLIARDPSVFVMNKILIHVMAALRILAHFILDFLRKIVFNDAQLEHFMILSIRHVLIAPLNANLVLVQKMGPGPDQCIKCALNYKIYNKKCTQCDFIPGFQSPMVNNNCYEVCGDSKNLGFHECDDGNLLNGDGCDENCMLEPGINKYIAWSTRQRGSGDIYKNG
ncbi:UNKNOWN [Stylonychia lemnae]|uniref:Uncharacterized protein n=1 Tax=Stylonychia lemnae TaxID=5949 RepID=A0A078AZL3_STYLE|nr:UNKNOWN [Stylonychia lemnae]|eukprot:CDW87619.1 UNKNOWN [Stylonychia lemnae]